MIRECSKCINSSLNPFIQILDSGLCIICDQYQSNFQSDVLKKELDYLMTFKQKSNNYDCLVGISGGKDSSATLFTIKQYGFNPLAFTFDIGYYPSHIFPRAKEVAGKLNVDHQIIDIRKYMRKNDKLSYKKTAELYDQIETPTLKQQFINAYKQGKKHYSTKCTHSVAYVRTCQLCRHTVIRAYYAEAIKQNIQLVILGINEWAGLSQDPNSKKMTFRAIRKLQPYKNKPAVYIVHLPFLLQRNLSASDQVLKKLGWQKPSGEKLIESNANSCLFAKAAEQKAFNLLGFHPDSTRLAREVTVGFITKDQAKKALAKPHQTKLSMRDILQQAQIL